MRSNGKGLGKSILGSEAKQKQRKSRRWSRISRKTWSRSSRRRETKNRSRTRIRCLEKEVQVLAIAGVSL